MEDFGLEVGMISRSHVAVWRRTATEFADVSCHAAQGRLALPDSVRHRLVCYPVAWTLVAGQFALTAAELRLLQRPSACRTRCAVRSDQGPGVSTMRSQLRSVFV